MSLIDQYLLIAFVFTVTYMIIVAQAIALYRILRSNAWLLIAAAFVLSGARLVWSLVRLPALIIKAQAEHKMADSLTTEQWIQTGVAGLVVVLLIVGFGKLITALKRVLAFPITEYRQEPEEDQLTSSQMNGAKLDKIEHMLSDVQHGTPPIPVVDEAVLRKLEEVTIVTDKKLDTIQEAADAAAEKVEKDKRES